MLKEVVTEYGFDAPVRWRRNTLGHVNASWTVWMSDGRRIVVRRLADQRTLAALRFEQGMIQELAARDITYRVPVPLSTRSGARHVQVGEHIYWAYAYIPGRVTWDVSPEVLADTAEAMTVVHRALSSWSEGRQALVTDYSREWLLAAMEQSLVHVPRALESDLRHRMYRQHCAAALRCLAALDLMALQALPVLPIHYDWNQGNLVRRNARVVGILDFDNARLGSTVQDVAGFLRHQCAMPAGAPGIDTQQAALFVAAYRRHGALSAEECRLLPAAVLLECAELLWWQHSRLAGAQQWAVTLDDIEQAYASLRWCVEHEGHLARLSTSGE